MSKKKGLKTRRFAIAHPGDQQGYVDQCGFVISWFNEMFKRAASDDATSAREARDALQTLIIHGVYELLGLALSDKGRSAGRWAAKLLAAIINEAELCETNEVYRPRKDHRGVVLISDVLPFVRLWYGEPNTNQTRKVSQPLTSRCGSDLR